jgi:trans-2,3-dihydro-3-hydroxyanthranilate isomerase
MSISYHVVDVFTQTPLEGNALAVFLDARGIDDATMQKIARELNLSETTFVLPPTTADAVARVRIFTPSAEMRFAGHPTIGTAFVLRANGVAGCDASHFVLEEKIGPVPVRVEEGNDPMFWLRTPPISFGQVYERTLCAQALGIAPDDLLPNVPTQLCSAGNPNIYVAVRDRSVVDRARIDTAKLHELVAADGEPRCVFVFAPTTQGAYSRMFAPDFGVTEDPATGSATGPLAQFMMEYGLAPRLDGTHFVSEQGTKMGRRSLLYVLVHGDRGSEGIEVGGHVTPIADGTMILARNGDE